MAYIKRKNCKRFIITDEKGKPMTWGRPDEQLCYSDSLSWDSGDEVLFVLETYSYKTAKKHIKKSKENRKKWGMGITAYELMPIYIR